MTIEYKLEGVEEAGYVGICGKKSPESLSLVCSRTPGGYDGWNREREVGIVRDKEKAGFHRLL